MKTQSTLPHIVVLGAGFGGLTFAQKFPRDRARITVVDRNNHHLFFPLLYQVATAGLSAPDITQPIRSVLCDRSDTTVLMDEVTAIDLPARRVALKQGELHYDYLVLALGSNNAYFGHPEWEQYAPGLKSIDDALRLRRDVLHAFERAECTDNPEERKRLLTIAVVGGGPTGVELAGAFAELQRHVLTREFRRVNPADGRVLLLQGGPRILENYPAHLSEKARVQLEELGVTIVLGSQVRDIQAGTVVTDSATFRAGTIVWAAGVQAPPITRTLDVQVDRGGRIKVAPDLSVPGYPEVFAIGDLAAVVDVNGVQVPGFCPSAMQMGAHVAKLIGAELQARGTPRPSRAPFAYFDKGTMATIGRSRAVAKLRRLELSGAPAWLTWLLVHLAFLIGFRNRIAVVTQWVYSYFTYRRGARVIYGLGRS